MRDGSVRRRYAEIVGVSAQRESVSKRGKRMVDLRATTPCMRFYQACIVHEACLSTRSV